MNKTGDSIEGEIKDTKITKKVKLGKEIKADYEEAVRANDNLTLTSDGFDVVIWRGEDFGCNVGANRMAPVNVETAAFDGEVKFAKEMCKRWNAYQEANHKIDRLETAIKETAKTIMLLDKETHPQIELDAVAYELADTLKGLDAILFKSELKELSVPKQEDD